MPATPLAHLQEVLLACGDGPDEYELTEDDGDARSTAFFGYANDTPVGVTATFTVTALTCVANGGTLDGTDVQVEYGGATPPSPLLGASFYLDPAEFGTVEASVPPGQTAWIGVKPFCVDDSDLFTNADVTVTFTVALACVSDDSCGVQIDPATRTVDDEEHLGLSVAVDVADEACEWTATVTSGGAWLTLASGASGTGDGATTYDVAEYDGEEERVGTILFETADDSATHTVTQTPCASVTVAMFAVQGQVPSRSRRQAGYRHAQGTPATVWTIPHNLGKYPTVTARDGSGNTLMGEIEHVDLNTVTITFGTARAGSAQLS